MRHIVDDLTGSRKRGTEPSRRPVTPPENGTRQNALQSLEGPDNVPAMDPAVWYAIGAGLTAIPSTIAAIASVRGNRKSGTAAANTAAIVGQLTTGNDLTVAEMVEDSHAKLSRDDRDFDKHHPSGPVN